MLQEAGSTRRRPAMSTRTGWRLRVRNSPRGNRPGFTFNMRMTMVAEFTYVAYSLKVSHAPIAPASASSRVTIIGVVADVRQQGLDEAPQASVYMPRLQDETGTWVTEQTGHIGVTHVPAVH